MKLVFKCHNKECQYYPCYAQCDKAHSESGMGDFFIDVPTECLFGMEEPNWKLVEFPPMTEGVCDFTLEWINGEGYEAIPEYLQDLLFGDGIRIDRHVEKIAKAIHLWNRYNTPYTPYDEIEEVKREINKVDKMSLLKGIFPTGFVAGLAFGEALRQTNGEYLKQFIRDEDY